MLDKINYSVLELNDEIVIEAKQRNVSWLINRVFKKDEKQMAEMICKLLSEEANKTYEYGDYDARKDLFNRKGVL